MSKLLDVEGLHDITLFSPFLSGSLSQLLRHPWGSNSWGSGGIYTLN